MLRHFLQLHRLRYVQYSEKELVETINLAKINVMEMKSVKITKQNVEKVAQKVDTKKQKDLATSSSFRDSKRNRESTTSKVSKRSKPDVNNASSNSSQKSSSSTGKHGLTVTFLANNDSIDMPPTPDDVQLLDNGELIGKGGEVVANASAPN